MIRSHWGRISAVLALVLLFPLFVTLVRADGDETLGTPSIPIEAGSGIVAAGTGLTDQPRTFNINVPGTSVT